MYSCNDRGRRANRFGNRFETFARDLAENLGEEFASTLGRGGSRRGGPGGFGRGEGRGRGRVLGAAELRLVLLKLIEATPRHGYELIKEIEARSGGGYAPSPGMVYPTLTLIADVGEADEVPDGTRKRYAITAAGRQALADEAGAVAEAMARLDRLAEVNTATDAAPIRRAMRNLHAAVHGRLGADADRELQLQVAALLDEVAGRIERL